VFVVKDGRAERRDIEIGLVLDERVHVVRGLAEGDQVIVTGQAGVRDGAAVQIISTAGKPAAGQ
jgi:membrane fusion protein (multidrug efflux system)